MFTYSHISIFPSLEDRVRTRNRFLNAGLNHLVTQLREECADLLLSKSNGKALLSSLSTVGALGAAGLRDSGAQGLRENGK